MKLIYVAGPYTNSDPWKADQNVRRAEEAAYEIMRIGGCWPLVPHSNTRQCFIAACTYDDALAGTLEMMRRSDAVYFLPDWETSTGARGERHDARVRGLPIFDSIADLAEWLKANTEAA